MERDCVLCFYCFTHEHQLTAEHNKEPAYISTRFRNWKKASRCFKEHEQSKCHTAALSYETITPKCGDPKEMISDEILNKRERERQYSLQYLARQDIAFRGNEDLDNNFTQLLLLRAKDYPWVKERILSQESGTKKYNPYDFQDEILNIMAKEVLRKKLYDVNNNKMYTSMCDEYTDVSDKQQLSICVREDLNPHEDFLGFYEVPNIKSDTVVSAIKNAFVRFNLPLSDLRGQTYDGASNMLRKKSGVSAQIKLIQPKAVVNHCHGHSLSLSVKDVTNSSRLSGDVIDTMTEITTLVKYSRKREQLLGSIQENIEFQDNDYSQFNEQFE